MIERALTASAESGAQGCVVIVEALTEAEVRFANNGTTTNGMRHDRRVAVVSFRSTPDGGTAAGSASARGAVDIEELLARADADAASSPGAEDAVALVAPGSVGSGGGVSNNFTEAPAETSPTVLDPVVGGLADAFGRARESGAVLAGFATHQVASAYLGTSTGLRLRHDQPQGSMELVARTTDGSRSAWAGTGTSWVSTSSCRRSRNAFVVGSPGPSAPSSSPPAATK